MGAAIGQVLLLAVAVAVSPIPIVAVVLMLSTPRGRVNGPAFALSWFVGLAVVGTIALLLASGASASDNGKPATWVSVLKLVLGLLLLVVAYREFRKRPRGDATPQLPGWMKSIDRFDPRRSAALGFGLSAINPKNLILTVSAAGAIAQTGISAGDQAVALAIYVLIGTAAIAVPVGIYFALGVRGTHILVGLRTWMARENATIMIVLYVLIAAKLIGDAITGFTS
jgi:threonine/homoserine/homoserine lactone efflux protein